MNLALEEVMGRALLLGTFSGLAIIKVVSVWQTAMVPLDLAVAMDLLAGIGGLAFQVLIIVLTTVRLPAKNAAPGLEPRLVAIGGTFLMLALAALPPGAATIEWKTLAALIIAVGAALSFYCAYRLGRSFAVMATARELVTDGPYGIVRHPLYASEMVILVGLVIANFSLGAVLLGAVTAALQFRRMVNEERILRSSFPEYDAYALRVPLFIPRLEVSPRAPFVRQVHRFVRDALNVKSSK